MSTTMITTPPRKGYRLTRAANIQHGQRIWDAKAEAVGIMRAQFELAYNTEEHDILHDMTIAPLLAGERPSTQLTVTPCQLMWAEAPYRHEVIDFGVDAEGSETVVLRCIAPDPEDGEDEGVTSDWCSPRTGRIVATCPVCEMTTGCLDPQGGAA